MRPLHESFDPKDPTYYDDDDVLCHECSRVLTDDGLCPECDIAEIEARLEEEG